jgi:hypothetical protein
MMVSELGIGKHAEGSRRGLIHGTALSGIFVEGVRKVQKPSVRIADMRAKTGTLSLTWKEDLM